MAEYIDLDKKIMVVDTRGRKLETTVRHILDFNNGEYEANDAQLVRHGRWMKTGDFSDEPIDWVVCDRCKAKIPDFDYLYCPMCGAKMDGGEE